PMSGFLTTGVCTVALPMLEPSGQEAGSAAYVAARQAFWIVVRREWSTDGMVRLVLPMFACPGAEVTRTLKVAPLALLACPATLASSLGLNGRLAQLAAWNGEVAGADAPCAPVIVPLISSGLQLVGLNWKPGRSMVTLICLSWAGMPCTKVGNASL